MAIKPEFEQEDAWEEFLDKTDPNKKVQKSFQKYTWSFGRDEDDDGLFRECVVLEVKCSRETETRQVTAKLTPKHLTLTVQGEEIINDDFTDHRWLDVQDSYWELEAKTDKAGERIKNLRYLLYLRSDYPSYVTRALFEQEKLEEASPDSDDDTVDTRMRQIANVKEPEPRRDDDVWFSSDSEFSDHECEGCGSKNVSVEKKKEDTDFKIYCKECPHVSVAQMFQPARSIRRQRAVDEARKKKREQKEAKKQAERKEVEDIDVPVDLASLQEVD